MLLALLTGFALASVCRCAPMVIHTVVSMLSLQERHAVHSRKAPHTCPRLCMNQTHASETAVSASSL